MSEHWEWRGFLPGDRAADPLDLARRVAQRFGADSPAQVEEDDDLYLVMPTCHHNVKFRGTELEVKEHVDDHGEHYSRWMRKRVFSYPIDGEATELIWRLAMQRSARASGSLRSPGDVLDALQRDEPALATVQLQKRRALIPLHDARLEVAQIVMPDGMQFLTYCVDGHHRDAVRDVVHQARLREGTRCMHYLTFLREWLWWHPTVRVHAAARR